MKGSLWHGIERFKLHPKSIEFATSWSLLRSGAGVQLTAFLATRNERGVLDRTRSSTRNWPFSVDSRTERASSAKKRRTNAVESRCVNPCRMRGLQVQRTPLTIRLTFSLRARRFLSLPVARERSWHRKILTYAGRNLPGSWVVANGWHPLFAAGFRACRKQALLIFLEVK